MMSKSVLDKNETEVTPSIQEHPPKSRGCLFWGCLTVIIVTVLGMLAAGIGFYTLYRGVYKFTSETRAEIPVYTPAPGEYEGVKQRIDRFTKAVDEGQSGVELALTGNDINAMIASDKDLEELAGKAYVRIENERISVDVSIPLDAIPGFSGRYLNGNAAIKASMENSILVVTIDSIEVDGRPLPEKYMKQFREKNMAGNLYEDKEKAELLRRVKDVTIRNGRLILISR